MKHENVPERSPSEPEAPRGPEAERHERLCAYLFGELAGEERAAFEAELAASSELRAEHARLVATVGLVQSALPDEGLSAAVRRDLLASARRSRFRVLGGRRLVSLAAAAMLLVGGAFAWRQWSGARSSPEESRSYGEVARKDESALKERRLEKSTAEAPAPAASATEMRLEGLGYSSGAPSDSLRDAPAATERALPSEEAESEPDVDAFEVQLAAKKPAATGGVFPGPGSPGGPSGPATPGGGGSQFGGRLGGRKDLKARGTATGTEGFFLGQAENTTGSYRGPGDSVPPGGATRTQPDEQRLLEALGYGGDDGDEARLGFSKRQAISPEDFAARTNELLQSTRLQPDESPRAMFFRTWGESPFVETREERLSTFAADVDTASYALMRAYLTRGQLPPREAVRTEEFVNYFKADQAPPSDGGPFALGLELAPSPFGSDARVEFLRATVRARDVADFQRQPVVLTFVIDNSGSMQQHGRLDLVKSALGLLLRQLRGGDSVAVVKFSNTAQVVTAPLPAVRRGELEGLIQAIGIEGGTNVEAGLRLGYEQAQQGLQRNAVNRVILCSDGVGNIGETSAEALLALVADARAKGIYLNTVGVGMGNHNDAFLEQLADRGDGVSNYVDGETEARRVFVDGLASALQPVARDVKLQLEFDPAQVERWRLLGYENRVLRAQDFRDDRIDAGEVNAGHQVSALYEVVRLPERSGPLATLRVRYKPPFAIDEGREGERARAEAEQALELERTLSTADLRPGFAGASGGFQRAVLAARFAEVLRSSRHARGTTFERLLQEARRLQPTLGDPDFDELVGLMGTANPLLDARSKTETARLETLLDELAQLNYEQARRERIRGLEREAEADEVRMGVGGRPARASEAEPSEEELATQRRIVELEAEVRRELAREAGLEGELRALGYAGDK